MSIEIRRLGFSYGSTDVLHDITFTAADGDITAVLGPNGVGKSTLFRCVLGFLAPSEGGILVNGKDMRTLDRRAAAREIAYIPQSCVPSFNYMLLEVVMMGLTNQIGVFDAPRPEHKTAALEAMESLGICHLIYRFVECIYDRRSQRLCDITNTKTDDLNIRVCFLIGSYFFCNCRKKITAW